jgi:hypothetical protein
MAKKRLSFDNDILSLYDDVPVPTLSALDPGFDRAQAATLKHAHEFKAPT